MTTKQRQQRRDLSRSNGQAKTDAFLSTYPGNVNTPIDLTCDISTMPEGWQYGDIVTFGSREAPQSGSADGVPVSIHPEQKYRLTRPA